MKIQQKPRRKNAADNWYIFLADPFRSRIDDQKIR